MRVRPDLGVTAEHVLVHYGFVLGSFRRVLGYILLLDSGPSVILNCLCAAFLLEASLTTANADEFLKIGKSYVHPRRILAKRRAEERAEFLTRAVGDVRIKNSRQIAQNILPNLFVLELESNLTKVATAGDSASSSGLVSPDRLLLEEIQTLRDSGLFDYVQPAYVYQSTVDPTDLRFKDGTLWALRNTGAGGGVPGADIGATRAWDITTGSTNVIVAVLDTGIRYTHVDLAAQMWRNPLEIENNGVDEDGDKIVDDLFGYNAAKHNGDPFDDNGHGTHIAGTIGAAANDGNPHVGVAWKVQLMACKFLAADGFGTTDGAIAAIDYAVRHGARIINASFAGGSYDQAMLEALTEARKQNVLFVAAAGNEFNDLDRAPSYPASYRLDNVISVAALDRQDRLASFSNYGRASVHLGAPGQDIFSCIADSDSSYDTFSGTSMAAPHVSGVAALILSKYPDASVLEVRERLLTTTVPIPALSDKTVSGGRLNAHTALTAVPDGKLEFGIEPPEGSDLSARRPVTFSISVTDLSAVTNALVRAFVGESLTPVVFRNDGKGPDFKAGDEQYSADLVLPSEPGPFSIKFEIEAPGKKGASRLLTYNIAAPPINDSFADALDVPSNGGLIFWTNRFATTELSEPMHAKVPSAASSVWWNWIPAVTNEAFVDTTGSAFDTVLAVYTNSPLNALREVASADDSAGKKQGYVRFPAIPGTEYHIAVASFASVDSGKIVLRIAPGGDVDSNGPQVEIASPPPGFIVTNATNSKIEINGTAIDLEPNRSGVRQVQIQVNRDVAVAAEGTTNWSASVILREGQNRIKVLATDYAGNVSQPSIITVVYRPVTSPNDQIIDALRLEDLSGTTLGDNSRASRENNEPLHAGNSGGRSIWWRFDPVADGVLSLSTVNSTFKTLLALYSGNSPLFTSLQLVSSNDDAFEGAGFSRLQAALKKGTSCWIAVDGFNGSTGKVQLTYSFTNTPVFSVAVESTPGGNAVGSLPFYAAGDSLSLSAVPEPFFTFDHWEGSIRSIANPLNLIVRQDTRLKPIFRSTQFLEGFESGRLEQLPWITPAAGGWHVQTNFLAAGRFAVRSGEIGNGDRSVLALVVDCVAGLGTFALKVSSEPTWDVLEFYLNGARLNRWSGEIPWTNYQFLVPAGTNRLEWRYSKDFLNTAAGLDAAFIDNLDLPTKIPIDTSTPARLGIDVDQLENVRIQIQGQTNQLYIVQTTDDFFHWHSISTNFARAGLTFITVDAAHSRSNLFFRAISP